MAAEPIGAVVNTGTNVAGKVIDTGVDIAGQVLNTGVNVAGEVIDTGVNVAGKVIDTGVHVADEVIGTVGNTLGFSSSYTKFVDLMVDFNIIGFALGLIIVQNIKELTNALIDGIVMPSLKPWIDSVTKEDDKITLFGFIHVHYGKFLEALIKFLTLSMLIYLAITIGMNLAKPVQWVSVRSVGPGIKL